jgi:hypothetical protein
MLNSRGCQVSIRHRPHGLFDPAGDRRGRQRKGYSAVPSAGHCHGCLPGGYTASPISAAVVFFSSELEKAGVGYIQLLMIAYDLLHGMLILKNACITLVSRCIVDIEANREVCRQYIENSIGLV